MNKKIYIAIAVAIVGLVAARVAAPRFGLFGSAIGDSDTSHANPAMQSRLSGDLTLTVIEQDGNGYRVRAELRGGQLDQHPASKTELNSSLAKPFYFTVNGIGEMSSFYFAKDLPQTARQLLKQAATGVQAVIPGGTQASWHTTEKDLSGEYEASYAAEGNTVTRRKTKYVRSHGIEGLIPVMSDSKFAVQSTATYELASSGWPRSVSSNESFDVDQHGRKLVVSNQVSATLTASGSNPQSVGAMQLAEVEPEVVADQQTAADRRLANARSMTKGRTFEQITADLEAKDNATRNHAQGQLSALFRLDARALDQGEDVVLRGGHTDNFMRRVIGSLAEADSPEAQARLVSIAERGSEVRQMDAIIALGLTGHPTAESGAAVRKAMVGRDDKLTSTATLSLGNMARRMAAHTGGDAKELIAPVLEQLQRTRDAHEQAVAVEALGNWGVPDAFPAIQPYLSNEDATLRAAAVGSLRFMKGQAMDTAVASAMSDKEEKVRAAAVGTLEYRPIAGVLPAVEGLIKTGSDKDVAMAVVKGLTARRLETPAVTELLHWIADNHSIPEVKKAAKGALGQST